MSKIKLMCYQKEKHHETDTTRYDQRNTTKIWYRQEKRESIMTSINPL